MKNMFFARILCAAFFMTLLGGSAIAQKQDNNLFLIVNDEGTLYGYINNKGKVVIKPQFSGASSEFSENMAIIVDTSSLYGFINQTGKVVIPAKYDDVTKFSEGVAIVKKDGKWIIIDKTGKTIAKCEELLNDYGHINIHEFHDGMALFSADDKYGYINKQGKIAIRPSFDYADNFSNGLAITRVETDKDDSTIYRIGYIDKSGSYVWSVRQAEEKYNYYDDDYDYDTVAVNDSIYFESTEEAVNSYMETLSTSYFFNAMVIETLQELLENRDNDMAQEEVKIMREAIEKIEEANTKLQALQSKKED